MSFSLFIFACNWSYFLSRCEALAKFIGGFSVTLGFAVTLIVGVGVCFYDVGPQINTFWRSRPIDPDTWYWSKFATGLLILVTVLSLPLLIVIVILQLPTWAVLSKDFPVVGLLAAQFALFAAAVAATSVTRQAVYGAILSIPDRRTSGSLPCGSR